MSATTDAFLAWQRAEANLDEVAGLCHPDAPPEVINDAIVQAGPLKAEADAAFDRWIDVRAEAGLEHDEPEAEL